MKTVYITDDGKKFDTFEAAHTYEEALTKKNSEKQKRFEEIKKHIDETNALITKYFEDYGNDFTDNGSVLHDLIKHIFD